MLSSRSSAPSRSFPSRSTALRASAYSSCSTLSLCGKPRLLGYSAFTTPTSFRSLLRTYDCSALPFGFFPRVLWPRLTSCSSLLLRRSDFFAYYPSARPPRVRTTTFLPCNRHIYRTELGQHWTSCCCAHSSAPIRPSYVVSVRRFGILPVSGLLTLDIRLPSDSTSRWTPLPSANASYCRARSGLSPPSCCPCRAH